MSHKLAGLRQLDPQDYHHGFATEINAEDKEGHDLLVATIARHRFAYPSKESPSLRTYVNVPKAVLSVTVNRAAESLCPDIVVANQVTKKAATIAEVETRATIDNERAMLWKKYSSLPANFYLYIPQSSSEAVMELVSFFRVRVTALRIYTYNSAGEAIISSPTS
jgi:hypothetical protein